MSRSIVLDAGAFIALERARPREVVIELVRKIRDAGGVAVTNDAALAQAWRDPSRQVEMARLVRTLDVYGFGDPRAIGQLCATAGTSDVVDASLAVLAAHLGCSILTTDPDDLAALGADVVRL